MNKIKRNEPECVAAADVKAENMNMALNLYSNASSPLIDMEIVTLMGGMIVVTKMRAKMFMQIEYFETVKPLSGIAGDCHVATLDIPTDELQNFLRGMLKKVFTWHYQAVGAFIFLHKEIYGEGYHNRYANVANVLGIHEMSTVQKWFSLHNAGTKNNVKVWMPLVKYIKWPNVKTNFTAALSEKWKVDDEETFVKQIDPYKKHIQGTDITAISTYTNNTSTVNRKAAAKNKAKISVLKNTANNVEHRDSNKVQKYKA